jgi:hypothetical protein
MCLSATHPIFSAQELVCYSAHRAGVILLLRIEAA